MHIKLEDFKTGWVGLQVGITAAEIPVLIERLRDLQRNRSHFHLRSDFSGSGGVGDVEFFWAEPDAAPNLNIE
ncbi:MAG: hypothetical protein ABIT37_17665 [Luteolibacter sp.]